MLFKFRLFSPEVLLILFHLLLCHSSNDGNGSPFENAKINIHVAPRQNASDLCFVMNFFGSDKGHPLHQSWHSYTNYYSPLFENFRSITNSNANDYPLRIFELGLGTNNPKLASNMGVNGKPGASLRGWEYYFKNSEVYGADIDKTILFNEGRIKTFHCDQTDVSSVRALWKDNPELSKGKFNIIIEDGLHNFEANVLFFENSIDNLALNGIFIIEDIFTNAVRAKWDRQLGEVWKTKYPNMEFRIIQFPYHTKKNHVDNNLIVAHRLS